VGVKPSAHGFSGGWLSAAHSYGFAEQLSCSLHQRELQGAQRMRGSERLGPGESAHPIAIPVLGWGTGPSHLSLDHLVGAASGVVGTQPSGGRTTQNNTPLLGPACLGAQT
jgi:hypothetical protein